MTGQELHQILLSKWGRSYDIQLRRIQGKIFVQVMWKYLEQKSFPLSEAEYLEPLDAIAHYLLRSVSHLSEGAQLFGFIYLLSHGVIKILLVVSLWNRKLWAYPAAIVFFILFVIYQLYRYSVSHSAWMLLLSALDAAIVFLTWTEYRVIRGEVSS